jgi:hypothetical protein
MISPLIARPVPMRAEARALGLPSREAEGAAKGTTGDAGF